MTGKMTATNVLTLVLMVLICLPLTFCGSSENPEGEWSVTIDHDFFRGNSNFPSGNLVKTLHFSPEGTITENGRQVGKWSMQKDESKNKNIVAIHLDWKFGGIYGIKMEGSFWEANKLTGDGKFLQGAKYAQFRYGCTWEAVRIK